MAGDNRIVPKIRQEAEPGAPAVVRIERNRDREPVDVSEAPAEAAASPRRQKASTQDQGQ